MLIDDRFTHFHYSNGGGFITSKPKSLHIEIDRETCKAEKYILSSSGVGEDVVLFKANETLIEDFFRVLEDMNWEEGPFLSTNTMDWPTWQVEINTENGQISGSNGSMNEAPRYADILQTKLDNIFGRENICKLFYL